MQERKDVRKLYVVPPEPKWVTEQQGQRETVQRLRSPSHISSLIDYFWMRHPQHSQSPIEQKKRADAGILLHRAIQVDYDPNSAIDPTANEVIFKLGGDAEELYYRKLHNYDRVRQLLPMGDSRVEQDVVVRIPGETAVLSGRVDHIITRNGKATVIDYKSGIVHSVDGQPNTVNAIQIAAYTLGLGIDQCEPPILASLTNATAHRLIPKAVDVILKDRLLDEHEKRARIESIKQQATLNMYEVVGQALHFAHLALTAKAEGKEDTYTLFNQKAQIAYSAFENLIAWEEITLPPRRLWQPSLPERKPIKPTQFAYDELIDGVLFDKLGEAPTGEERRRFLHPRLDDLTLKNTGLLDLDGKELGKGIATAVSLLHDIAATPFVEDRVKTEQGEEVIQRKRRIVIAGQQTVDGALAASLLRKGIASYGIAKDALSLTMPATVAELVQQQAVQNVQAGDVLVLLNQGSTEQIHELVKAAQKKQVKVLFLDHTPLSDKGFPTADGTIHTRAIPATAAVYMLLQHLYGQNETLQKQLVQRLPLAMLAVRADKVNDTLTKESRIFDKVGFGVWSKRNDRFLRLLESAVFEIKGEKYYISPEQLIGEMIRVLGHEMRNGKKEQDILELLGALTTDNQEFSDRTLAKVVDSYKKQKEREAFARRNRQHSPSSRKPLDLSQTLPMELFCRRAGETENALLKMAEAIEEVGPFSIKNKRPTFVIQGNLEEALPSRKRTRLLISDGTNGCVHGTSFVRGYTFADLLGEKVAAHAQFQIDEQNEVEVVIHDIQAVPPQIIPWEEVLQEARRRGMTV